MTTNPKLPEIRKEVFTKAREKLGLSTKDLGGMACLSTRQIEQIENGEISSFYGAQIKVTAAKKVARLLQLDDQDAFDYGVQTLEKKHDAIVELPIAEVKAVKNLKVDVAKKVSTNKVDQKQDTVEAKKQVKEAQLPETGIEEEKKESTTKVQSKEIPFTRSAGKTKSTSQKKLLLSLSVFAAIAFSVINLRPLFFADKPAEIILVKEEIVEPVSVATPAEPVPVASVATVAAVASTGAEISTACPPEEGIISYKPDAPRKAADVVYIQVKAKQVVCVSDASGKVQNRMIEPGVGASFNGKPPFKVLTNSLAHAEVFFQGAKVRLSNPNVKTLILEASEVIVPSSDRTDSQLR